MNAETNMSTDSTKERTTFDTLLDIIKLLLKRWWIFLIIGALAGLGGYYYAGLQKQSYQSRVTFVLDDAGDNGMSGAFSLAAQFGLNVNSGSSLFSGDNIIEILKSRHIVEKVLLSTDTFNNKPYTLIEYFLQLQKKAPSKSPEIHFPVGQSRSTFSYQQDSVLYGTYLGFATANIAAQRPDRKLMIFEINVSTPEEKLTKVFSDKLVQEANNFYVEIVSKKAKQTLDVLEMRVAAMKGNLNSSISGRAASQDANLNPALSATQVPVLKQQANIQVYSGAYSELFKNLEMARFQYLNKIPLMQIIDPADYPMKKVKASKLKTALSFAVIAELLVALIIWLTYLLKK